MCLNVVRKWSFEIHWKVGCLYWKLSSFTGKITQASTAQHWTLCVPSMQFPLNAVSLEPHTRNTKSPLNIEPGVWVTSARQALLQWIALPALVFFELGSPGVTQAGPGNSPASSASPSEWDCGCAPPGPAVLLYVWIIKYKVKILYDYKMIAYQWL
jgi:hypothetical protein